MARVIQYLAELDRRWIFLMIILAVAIPLLFRLTFPEIPTPVVQAVFDRIEQLPPGSKVLVAMDYDPGSEPELQPMAIAITRHLCLRRQKIYFISLWPLGPDMTEDVIRDVIRKDFPQYKYGQDYVNLGYKSGNEGVIKVIVTDLKKLYTTDHHGTSLDQIPMTRNITNIQQMDLIVSISAGYAGTKEWVQYAGTPYRIPVAGGVTGVQAPLLYPYIPDQLLGLLGAIKGAAEYEAALRKNYPQYDKDSLNLGIQRMGPQLVAHVLIMALIVLGNVILLLTRRQRGRTTR